MTDPIFARWGAGALQWLPHYGIGWLPVSEKPYDEAYWQKYVEYAQTEKGRAILHARLRLTDSYARVGTLVDVGIGCGAFVEARGGSTYGFDISPVAVSWLNGRQLWLDPYETPVLAATFWDSLEHIGDAHRIIANVQRWIFVTVPIVPGDGPPRADWRHYRPDEHCLYFTRRGLIAWMAEQNFRCVEHNTMESLIGREDSETFVFRRITG